eukprot:TRINITY_DN55892_c0_g1_i1.p1 TRINITY_DN55892_c0_g1~~TRINITY_DN55892_c0_g1_i1.p1  ORF type:complete len:281 (+),score=22.25 TRINITY_DN55892_c0_g1_i1:136-978(+)
MSYSTRRSLAAASGPRRSIEHRCDLSARPQPSDGALTLRRDVDIVQNTGDTQRVDLRSSRRTDPSVDVGGHDTMDLSSGNAGTGSVTVIDPSLADGHRIIYDREVPVELRTTDASTAVHEPAATEPLRIRVLTLPGENLRVELASENDLFFHYVCNLPPAAYRELATHQKLLVSFDKFAAVVVRMLNRCIKEPQLFFAVLVLQPDGSAVLEFLQSIEHKLLDLLVLPFAESPDYMIRQHVAYRYSALKSRVAVMQARLHDVASIVRARAKQAGAVAAQQR